MSVATARHGVVQCLTMPPSPCRSPECSPSSEIDAEAFADFRGNYSASRFAAVITDDVNAYTPDNALKGLSKLDIKSAEVQIEELPPSDTPGVQKSQAPTDKDARQVRPMALVA